MEDNSKRKMFFCQGKNEVVFLKSCKLIKFSLKNIEVQW